MSENDAGAAGVSRVIALMRALARVQVEGGRVTQLAREAAQNQATTHRLLQSLVAEGMVEQEERSKRYRLTVDFFALAAQAGNVGDLRSLCRPALLRLSASLGDSLFLLARAGFDAICLDRSEGPFPIRSFTGDVGGRVPLGAGQGALAILAFLPEAEREEVIRFNLSRLREFGFFDEVQLRVEILKVREAGFAAKNSGLLEGMAGVAVPIIDREGRAVGALAVGTILDRLNGERLPTVVELLKREASALGERVNPFDVSLRRPGQVLSGLA